MHLPSYSPEQYAGFQLHRIHHQAELYDSNLQMHQGSGVIHAVSKLQQYTIILRQVKAQRAYHKVNGKINGKKGGVETLLM